MTTRFDDSLPNLVKLLARHFGPNLLTRAAILRDASGRLSAILPERIGSDVLASAEAAIYSSIQSYARPDRVIGDIESSGADMLLRESKDMPTMNVGGHLVRLIDRRIIGSDWLRPPAQSTTSVPRIVFSSLKGGVGRSTALCVLAAHLCRGRRVLAVDFDLEAPGIGTMLLDERELPQFGTLDYLVENGISGIDDMFMSEVSGDSILGAEGARVTVVPAIGRRTIDNPHDALSKIARSYLEDIKDDGKIVSLSEQLNEMVSRFEKTDEYDVVLVDSRAGLHETTAAAILGLGAEILLFGLDQPQTFLGYRLLLAHLARFPIQSEDDWRDRLQFVHAKASESSEKRKAADQRFSALYDLVMTPTPLLDDLRAEEVLTAEDFDFEWRQEDEPIVEVEAFEPSAALHILDDTRYRDFDPVLDREILASSTYASTFGTLLDYGDMIVEVAEFEKS